MSFMMCPRPVLNGNAGSLTGWCGKGKGIQAVFDPTRHCERSEAIQ
jgi:hypothetical protein